MIEFASSSQSTGEKKVSMMDPNYSGFQANALQGVEVLAGFVVMNYVSPSLDHVPTSPFLHSSCRSSELQ